ncbi:MAG: hypothetical protein ACYC1T_02815 [Sulfuricaulis sp.]
MDKIRLKNNLNCQDATILPGAKLDAPGKARIKNAKFWEFDSLPFLATLAPWRFIIVFGRV